jgi:hypothetical protein
MSYEHVNFQPRTSKTQKILFSSKRPLLTIRSTIPVPLLKWAPGVFHTYYYNHANRRRLEILLYLVLPRSPNGFLNRFWVQVAVSLKN